MKPTEKTLEEVRADLRTVIDQTLNDPNTDPGTKQFITQLLGDAINDPQATSREDITTNILICTLMTAPKPALVSLIHALATDVVVSFWKYQEKVNKKELPLESEALAATHKLIGQLILHQLAELHERSPDLFEGAK